MSTPVLATFDDIRAEAGNRVMARTSWKSFVLFEPVFLAMTVCVIVESHERWRHLMAIGCLVVVVAMALWGKRLKLRQYMVVRWLLGFEMIVITGGLNSPLLPLLIITIIGARVFRSHEVSLAMASGAIVAVWILYAVQRHDNWLYTSIFHTPSSPLYLLASAVCTSSLLGATWAIGGYIRVMGDEMLRLSLEARDETLRVHAERLREMTTLSAQIAHELKNPLASIKGLGALMELDPARAGERLKVLRQEVERMQVTLDEFLNFSRPLTPLAIEAVDLQEVVATVVSLHEGMADQKQIRLDASGAESIEIRCDPRKVIQILMNLVQNAIDASPVGAAIELTVTRVGEHVRLGVLDRGPGLPPDLGERVLEPGITTKAKGSGLGLTIVRSLVEQHYGTLRLVDRAGGGLSAEVDLLADCPAGTLQCMELV